MWSYQMAVELISMETPANVVSFWKSDKTHQGKDVIENPLFDPIDLINIFRCT